MAQGRGSKKHTSGSRNGELQVPPDHDWRSTDSEEIDRRRQRARDERMRIANLTPEHPVFSNFEVHSGSGRSYQVEIRDVSSREFACDCVDFRSNGLGTCKHVEAVLLWLQRRHRPALRQGVLTGSDRLELLVDRERGQLFLRAPSNLQIPQSLSRWFNPNGTLRGDDPHAAVQACQKVAADRPALRISLEVAPWLELNRRREESIAARREYEARVQSGEWPPQETLVPLLPYQRAGMLHLAFRERALLADEMGLGKTIQAIAACALLHRLGRARRVLVVSPASLKAEWEEQIRRFTPLSARLVFGHHLARKKLYRQCASGEDNAFFILTNYEQAVPDLEIINSVLQPDVIILDEAQRIKNWNTKTSRRIKQLQSRYAFILTGTPIENRIDELRSLVDYLDPAVLGPLFRFNRDFYQLNERGRPVGVRNLDALHRRVQHLLLRRRKSEVANELPTRTDHHRFVQLTPKQRTAYASHEQEVMILASLAERRALTPREQDQLQRELAMMRMICDTNFILDPKDRECPKLTEIARILEDSAAEGSKVIVFSEWERMLELVRDYCRDHGLDCAWHTGSVPQQKRRADINRFKEDPQCRVFLSTDAGATGLNLQVASVVVNCDLPWNPARLEQRIARAWRKFQTQAVTVINLISEDTIEHRMLETLATKRSVAEGVLDRPGEITSVVFRKSAKDTADRLRSLTRRDGEAAPAPKVSSAQPRDVPREFAARLKQQFGPQVLSCEECHPVAGGPTRILVVVQHPGSVLSPSFDGLRESHFPVGESGTPSCDVEVIDRATQEAIERLVKAGLLQRVEGVRRDLLAAEIAPRPLTDEEQARRDAAAVRAERLLRRAQVLGEADFPEEAAASLREALLPMAIARAIGERWPVPTNDQDLLKDRWITTWGSSYLTVQHVLAGTVADPAAARVILTIWMSQSSGL